MIQVENNPAKYTVNMTSNPCLLSSLSCLVKYPLNPPHLNFDKIDSFVSEALPYPAKFVKTARSVSFVYECIFLRDLILVLLSLTHGSPCSIENASSLVEPLYFGFLLYFLSFVRLSK